MITTEEFFKHYSSHTALTEDHYNYLVDEEAFKEAMIEFAEYHVKEALKAAYENIEYTEENSSVPYVIEDSILNAYPLDKIK